MTLFNKFFQDSAFSKVYQDSVGCSRVLKDSLDCSLRSPNAVNSAAINASLHRLHDIAFPRRAFASAAMPKRFMDYMEDCKDIATKNLDRFYIVGVELQQTGSNLIVLGREALDSLRFGGYVFVALFGFGAAYAVSSFIRRRIIRCNGDYCWLVFVVNDIIKKPVLWFSRTPNSNEGYKNMVDNALRKGELDKVHSTLVTMLDNGFAPDANLFKVLLTKLFDEKRLDLSSHLLKMMIEVGVDGPSDLVSDVLSALLLRGKFDTAVKRMESLIENGTPPDFYRISKSFREAGKKPPAGLCLKFFKYLLSKNQGKDAYLLLIEGFLANCQDIPYEVLEGLLFAQGFLVEAGVVEEMHGA